ARPAALGGARPEAVDHDVGARGEATEQLLPFRSPEVDRHALLPPVPAEVHQVHARELPRSDVAEVIAGRGLFDLDDLRAEIGEMHTEEVGREEGELHDPDAAEERVHCASAPLEDGGPPFGERLPAL